MEAWEVDAWHRLKIAPPDDLEASEQYDTIRKQEKDMSGTTVGAYTVESAPREQEKLANIGRFQLRRLAEELGLLNTEQKKNAFMSGTPSEMAQAVSMALRTRDASGGTVVSAPPMMQEVPVQAPVVEAPVREPRTRARVEAPIQAQEGTATPAFLAELRALTDNTRAELMGLNKLVKDAGLSDLLPKVERLEEAVVGLMEQNKFLFSIVLMVAEQHIRDASRTEILRTAAEDVPFVLKDLERAIEEVANKE
jgi:hypothetical protein